MDKLNLIEALDYIDPGTLSYQEWTGIGMALKEEGYTASDWDTWSKRDLSRYHAGECFKKWDTFRGAPSPVTAGTIVHMAKDGGWQPYTWDEGDELAWDAVIGAKDELKIIDTAWVEEIDIKQPEKWDPVKEITTYLSTLFEASENVGYVMQAWQQDERWLPTKGNSDRSAGELIEQLNKCKGDIGAVLGDYKKEAGAWIRFNPLDGKGVKNENVTEYRYALVESDHMELAKQNAIIRELELPVACLVFSGKKSLHAIVRIDAANYDEYRKRVDYLYTVLKKNGMPVDTQNKNPSRLSRMPGIERNGQKQFLIDTNIGKPSWAEWHEWIEGVNDDLPDPEALEDTWDNLPDLSPALIEGVLRQGHKMLLAGPSKAGKSYSLIEMAIAIAEGKKWLQWQCAQGRVLYVNLELDRASCLHRFKDVYKAMKMTPKNLKNIDIWNLRGKAVPMDKLAPKLIRRAQKKGYIAIIIDPIYKVITGDENSADQMAKFCNQFDLVCHDLGAAVIYCHHHSKGTQGQKRSMDRASGSGVFARDPDALLDLIELETNEDLMKQQENNAVCAAAIDVLDKHSTTWEDHVSQDDMRTAKAMEKACDDHLVGEQSKEAQKAIQAAKTAVQHYTAWRIEGTLREYPRFAPINLWFRYPVHVLDDSGALQDVDPEGEMPMWKQAKAAQKTPEEKQKDRNLSLEMAYEACGINGKVTVQDLAEYMGVTSRTVWNYVKEHGGFAGEKQSGKSTVIHRKS